MSGAPDAEAPPDAAALPGCEAPEAPQEVAAAAPHAVTPPRSATSEDTEDDDADEDADGEEAESRVSPAPGAAAGEGSESGGAKKKKKARALALTQKPGLRVCACAELGAASPAAPPAALRARWPNLHARCVAPRAAHTRRRARSAAQPPGVML